MLIPWTPYCLIPVSLSYLTNLNWVCPEITIIGDESVYPPPMPLIVLSPAGAAVTSVKAGLFFNLP